MKSIGKPDSSIRRWLVRISSRAVVLLALLPLSCSYTVGEETTPSPTPREELRLPPPRFEGETSVEESLLKRRSVREFRDEPLALEDLSQLLWAAQGTTAPAGFRTAPSAGATYPLEAYVVVGNVTDLAPGIYRYLTAEHKLEKWLAGDLRAKLASAALDQGSIKEGAINIVLTAVYERTTNRYGDRGDRYVHMEAGHAAQNVCLQAVALDLGAVVIGAFFDDQVQELIGVPRNENPLYIIPVGKPKG